MKQKIKEALQQRYKNLGLNDEAFDGVAASVETIITEDNLDNFVKGAEGMLKKMQSDADKVRNAIKQGDDYKAKLAEAEAKLNKPIEGEGGNGVTQPSTPDFAKLISEAVTAAVQPLQEKIATFEGVKNAERAFNDAKTSFFGNDYANKYTKERDVAWERAVEINEVMGNKMSADELHAKAMSYFKKSVAEIGVDIEKPFKSEGEGNNLDFSDDIKLLESEGLLKKEKV